MLEYWNSVGVLLFVDRHECGKAQSIYPSFILPDVSRDACLWQCDKDRKFTFVGLCLQEISFH